MHAEWLAWGAYAVAVAVGQLAAWRLSRRWPQALRDLVRGALAGMLLTPWQVPGTQSWAPALIVLIFEGLFQEQGNAAPAAAALLGGSLCGLALMLAWRLQASRHVRGRGH
jgi:hypothetical protein